MRAASFSQEGCDSRGMGEGTSAISQEGLADHGSCVGGSMFTRIPTKDTLASVVVTRSEVTSVAEVGVD